MVARRSLVDTTTDQNAKEAFIREANKKPAKRQEIETKMLNTRVPKDLIKRVKAYCVEHETTVQEFVTETLEKRLKK